MSNAIADDEGSSIRILSYEHDEFYRLIGTIDSGNSTDYQFGYDALDRMISQVEDADWSTFDIELDFVYNAVGNRKSMAATIGGNLDYKNTYTYDSLDLLRSIQQSGQSGGNSVADKRIVYQYDDASRMTFVNRYEDTTNTNPAIRTIYSYDSEGTVEATILFKTP